MLKRILCIFLSTWLLMGVLFSAPLSVRAEGDVQPSATQAVQQSETTQESETEQTTQTTQTTAPPTETTQQTQTTVPEEELPVNETRMSEEGIALLKQFEGFRKYPYWDVTQWSVGYGTRCPGDKLALWQQEGISEREAEGLLFTFINNFGGKLDAFIEQYGLSLNQHQYDALMLFTYNVGGGWMNQEGLLRTAVISGATGNDFIYPFVLWCKSDRVFSNGLIERRLAEANLYLNGVYGRKPPSDYSFVRFDVNGGKSDYAVQGYDVDVPVPIMVIAETTYTASNGAVYEFDGWYTSRTGGTKVETLDNTLGYGIYLYAHWNMIKEGTGPSDGSGSGGTSVLVDVVVTAKNLNVRTGPGTNYDTKTSYPKGTQLTIVETQSGSGYLWGKIANTGNNGYWVCLEYTNYYEVIQGTGTTTPPATQPPTPPVTQAPTQKPTQPPTQAPTQPPTQAPTQPSTQVPTQAPTQAPTQKPTQPTTPSTQPQGTLGSWSGVVKTSGARLIIRKESNTNASIMGYLFNGDAVTIVERKMVDDLEWGRMEKGWICLKYVSFDLEPTTPPETQPPTTEATKPTTAQPVPTEPKPTQPVTEPVTEPETEPSQSMTPQYPAGDGYWIGVVKAACLPIRADLGMHDVIVGYYRLGDSVEVTHCATADGQLWGKVDIGWICLSGVDLDGEITAAAEGLLTVNTCSLRVRIGAGLENGIVSFLSRGDVVAVYEQQQIGFSYWGLTDYGWVDLKYLE